MNPEFQRYLWLELTPQRLLVAPVLSIAVFALVALLDAGNSSWALSVTAYWLTIGLGILWGARDASEAVIGEVREATWDQQRLSSLGPWAMTWGKLFGAPVFSWYASVPALVMIVPGAAARTGVIDAIAHVALLIAVVVFAHAVGLLVSLQLAARSTVAATRSMVGLHLLGLVAGALTVAPVYSAFAVGWGEPVHWFTIDFPHAAFTWFTVASLMLWAVIGCYRLMRAELQMHNAPWVWIAFVAYCMVYGAGWAWAEPGVQYRMARAGLWSPVAAAPLVAYFVALALALVMLFFEPKEPVEFRRLLASLRDRRWPVFLQCVPRWLCALPIAAAVMLALVLTEHAGAAFCVSAMAFFIRDAGIVVWLNLSPNRRRADAAALLYLLVLYGLLPAILSAASGAHLDGWLFPSMHKGLLAATLPALVQAAVVWLLARRRWQGLWAAVEHARPRPVA